jgi:N-acetylglucosaminyldiphosphoundecaprenol N-acetyl-beta-D-mannosaminyltransferase
MPDVSLLGVRVGWFDRGELEQSILAGARTRSCKLYAYVNIHAVNIATRDPRFRAIVNGAAVTYCDGAGVRLGSWVLGRRLPPRTVLTYWIWDLCRLLEEEGLSLYLLGGKEEVVRVAAGRLQSRFPRLKIAGWHHGYFAKEGEENSKVVEEINLRSPDVLFVGFGMPLQEYWIEENKGSLNTGVVLPSGSMIDYVAGAKKSAPVWMGNHGLEWLYRLSKEPRRLWRRYLIGNPLFLFRVIAQRFRSGRI